MSNADHQRNNSHFYAIKSNPFEYDSATPFSDLGQDVNLQNFLQPNQSMQNAMTFQDETTTNFATQNDIFALSLANTYNQNTIHQQIQQEQYFGVYKDESEQEIANFNNNQLNCEAMHIFLINTHNTNAIHGCSIKYGGNLSTSIYTGPYHQLSFIPSGFMPDLNSTSVEIIPLQNSSKSRHNEQKFKMKPFTIDSTDGKVSITVRFNCPGLYLVAVNSNGVVLNQQIKVFQPQFAHNNHQENLLQQTIPQNAPDGFVNEKFTFHEQVNCEDVTIYEG